MCSVIFGYVHFADGIKDKLRFSSLDSDLAISFASKRKINISNKDTVIVWDQLDGIYTESRAFLK